MKTMTVAHAEDVADRWTALMSDGVGAVAYRRYGQWWMVTDGTNEAGRASFAYDIEGVEAWLDEGPACGEFGYYQDFCDALSPEEDRDLALAVHAVHGMHLCAAGACQEILSDEDVELIDSLRLSGALDEA